METYDSMFGYFFAFAGVMSLYFAFTGKGMAYKSDYPKEIKEDADKLLRVFLWIIGPLLIAQGILDIKGITAQYRYLYLIFMVVALGILTVYFIIFRKRFGKALKKTKSKEINKSL